MNTTNEVPTPAEQAQRLMGELEALGCAVIVWVPEDFPGSTPEKRQANFDLYVKDVVDVCIERGNEMIADWCTDEDEDEDEE
jgi:hypothetical protein